jgi:hypothetical protein
MGVARGRIEVFGSRPRTLRRPLLLVLVFGAFLAIVGTTATAQAAIASLHLSTGTINAVVSSDAATVRALLNDSVTLADLEPGGGPAPSALRTLESRLAALTRPGEIVRVELRRLDGTIVAASEAGLAGTTTRSTAAAARAADGATGAAILPAAEAGAAGPIGAPSVLEEFMPITVDGRVRAVVGVWRDAEPILARLEGIRRDVVGIALSAAAGAAPETAPETARAIRATPVRPAPEVRRRAGSPWARPTPSHPTSPSAAPSSDSMPRSSSRFPLWS